jgi:hypothetical protein
MPTKLTLADGETFVEGRSRDKAAELVKLAAAAGLKGSVRTTYNGYIVPSSILDDADAEADATDADDKVETFDPSKATVDEVAEYLEGADETERERVLAAEAEGKKRKGVLDLATTTEEAE